MILTEVQQKYLLEKNHEQNARRPCTVIKDINVLIISFMLNEFPEFQHQTIETRGIHLYQPRKHIYLLNIYMIFSPGS